MDLKRLPGRFTVCRLPDPAMLDLSREFYFVGRTDEELSLLCRTEDTPPGATDRNDGWRGFRIEGVLDFSLVGILSAISGILAGQGIGLFAVSTFNPAYVFVKEENFERALSALSANGYRIV